jgi:hypothetical protein
VRVFITVCRSGAFLVRVPAGKQPPAEYEFPDLFCARAFCVACDFTWVVTA